MGKVHISHLVIHDKLKLPITRQGAFNLFKSKNSKCISKETEMSDIATNHNPSHHENQSTSDNIYPETNTQDKISHHHGELNNANSFSDDSGINLHEPMTSRSSYDIPEEREEEELEMEDANAVYNIMTPAQLEERAKNDTIADELLNLVNSVLKMTDKPPYTVGINKDLQEAGCSKDSDNISSHSDEDAGLTMKSLNVNVKAKSPEPAFDPANISADSFQKALSKVEFLENQVAGHMHGGMVKWNGKVLKPIVKKECGEREIRFYERLLNTSDPDLLELRDMVPRYYGTRKITIEGIELNSIILEDLTLQYRQPCIIDIKIGKRTWDPTATCEKIKNEEKKYADCKRDLSFCIPGFQVYNLKDNKLYKFDKEYGKSLNKDTAKEALKKYLNAEGGFCRKLLVQILGQLWRIEHWARKQRALRLYSSSILIIYEAKCLKEFMRMKNGAVPKQMLTRSKSLYRPLSLAILNNNELERIQTGFSGQLTKEGPILHTRSYPSKMKEVGLPVIQNKNNTWKRSINLLKRTHSFQNDYDKEVQDKKQDYTNTLDDLVCEDLPDPWVTVKLIDFAHVFPGENCDIDKNYLEGISKLIKVCEDFLAEAE